MIISIRGVLQHYDWGGREFLPRLLGIVSQGGPCAEYWLGTHANYPATVEPSGQSLREYLAQQGREVSVPYLFKILDVAGMLSIQAHPSCEQAQAGFADENRRGVPIDSPQRVFKDANHKPEMAIALGEFYLLSGFRVGEDLLSVLRAIPELAFLADAFVEGGYPRLYDRIHFLTQEEVNDILRPLCKRVTVLQSEHRLDKTDPHYWAARACNTFVKDDFSHIDKGIFFIYLLNLIRLDNRQSYFHNYGTLHAYLHGQCVEIMANSDNVLRCGLTSKHTQPDLLRTHICYEPTHVHIGEPVVINEYEVYWRSPVRDFILGEITLACSQSYTTHCRDTDIFFAYRGKGTVTQLQANAQSPSLSFEQGSSWLGVGGQGLSLHAHQANSIFRASVNNLFTNPHC